MSEPVAALSNIEAYEGLAFDARLAEALWATGRRWRTSPLLASTPSFKRYESEELERHGSCARAGAYPAFSITGGACALGCAHCGGRILEPMIAARNPAVLDETVRAMIARQGLSGFLLSGGSTKRNEVPFDRYLPVVERLKRDYPALEIAVHTGLVDSARARSLADAGVDVAMLDIIGAEATIRDVYNLGRPVADFEASLAHLVAAGLGVVPHVVIGLHFGRILGEHAAMEIIARHRTAAAILVVLMPHLADERFATPSPEDVATVFQFARERLADRKLLLGCARPSGRHRRLVDAYAVLAGLDGIAHPADGAVTLARAMGRPTRRSGACCGADGCRTAA